MAGHSKWANIKFRKAAQDAKRGKVFTKLIKEITVSARLGGADTDSNPRLRSAIDKALAANMTRDTIDRAIKRGAGAEDGSDLMEIRYEGYGPGGVAFLVECATDNRNRTVSEVRHMFSKYGGNLGTDGSVAYLFNRVGILVFSDQDDEEKIFDMAIEAGAEDVDSNEGMVEVTTSPETYHQIAAKLKGAGLTPEISEVIQRPTTEVQVSQKQYEQIAILVDALEEMDDVQNVFTNLGLSEDE